MEFDLNFNLTTNLFSTYYVLDTIEKDKDLKKKKTWFLSSQSSHVKHKL